MNAKDRIKNWQDESIADLKSAKEYINNDRLLHGLFLCHLVIEKSLKALLVKLSGNAAPKSHDILLLAEKAELKFSKNELSFIKTLIKYKLHGRYPKGSSEIPSKEISKDLYKQTKAFINKVSKT